MRTIIFQFPLREQTPLERFKADQKLHTVGIKQFLNYLLLSLNIYEHLVPLNQAINQVNGCELNNVQCLNGGTCVPNGREFECQCADGFAGEFCGKGKVFTFIH